MNDETGEVFWNENLNSDEHVAEGYTYLGDNVPDWVLVDDRDSSVELPEIIVYAKQPGIIEKVTSKLFDKPARQIQENQKSLQNAIRVPDFFGLQFSFDYIVIGGYGADISIGYMRNNGFYSSVTPRVGNGYNVGVSATVSVGYYQGHFCEKKSQIGRAHV